MKIIDINVDKEEGNSIIYSVTTSHWFGLTKKVTRYKERADYNYKHFPNQVVLFDKTGEVLGGTHPVTKAITNYKRRW